VERTFLGCVGGSVFCTSMEDRCYFNQSGLEAMGQYDIYQYVSADSIAWSPQILLYVDEVMTKEGVSCVDVKVNESCISLHATIF